MSDELDSTRTILKNQTYLPDWLEKPVLEELIDLKIGEAPATELADKVSPLIDSVSAQRIARGEAVRTGTYIPVGDGTVWNKYPSGTGTVTYAQQTVNTPESLTIANTVAGGNYRIGRAFSNLMLGNGRFVSFMFRKNDNNLSTIGFKNSFSAADIDPANVWDFNSNNLDTGRWHRIAFHTGEGFDQGTVTNRFTMNALTITVVATAGTTTSVSFADFRVHEGDPRGKVSFLFDDGMADVYTKAYPMLKAKGWVGGTAVEYLGINTPGYCTTEQLQQMHAEGWDMHGHARLDMTQQTAESQVTIYGAAKNFLLDNGLTRGSRIWVWPGGLRNAATEAIASRYFKTLRCVNNWVRTGMPHVYEYRQPPSYYWTSTKTVANIKTQIDLAEKSGCSVVFTLHNLVDSIGATEDVLTTSFQEILDYVATKNVDVVAPSQIWTL